MKKPQNTIPAVEPAEIDNPLNEQNAANENIIDIPDNSRKTRKIFSAARQFRQRLDWSLVWQILAIKGLIVIFGVQIYYALLNKPGGRWRDWLELWNRWDSIRYVRIAQFGYSGDGSDKNDLFGFPLFPWIVRLFSYVFQDYLISGFIVSGLAAVAAGLLFYKLVRIDYSDSIARNSVWFLLIFPTAYFLHINYNESLFIALAVGSLLAARREHWAIAGILGAFLCLTRVNGLVIIPTLLTEAFLQFRVSRRWQNQWLWLAVAPFGFGIFLLLNQHVTGDAFAFITIGRETFYKTFDTPWHGIRSVYRTTQSYNRETAQMGGVYELVFIILGAVGTIASLFLLRPSYTVWIALDWLLVTSVGFVISVPRFTLSMFPIFILFAKLAERRFWFGVITVWSLLLMALFVSKFIQGQWAF